MKNIVFYKKRCLEFKKVFLRKMSYLKDRCSKTDFLIKIINDSAWFCMEKLKNTVLRPTKQKIIAKNTQKIPKNTHRNPLTRDL